MDKMKERTWVGGGEPIVNTQGHSVMWEPGWGVAGKQVRIRGGVGGRSADAFRSWWRGEERGAADVWTAMQILETKEMALLQSVPSEPWWFQTKDEMKHQGGSNGKFGFLCLAVWQHLPLFYRVIHLSEEHLLTKGVLETDSRACLVVWKMGCTVCIVFSKKIYEKHDIVCHDGLQMSLNSFSLVCVQGWKFLATQTFNQPLFYRCHQNNQTL